MRLFSLVAHSRVFPDKETMMAGALEMAGEIASKSPVAVQGTKVNLIYSRDHSVPEALNYIVRSQITQTSRHTSVY